MVSESCSILPANWHILSLSHHDNGHRQLPLLYSAQAGAYLTSPFRRCHVHSPFHPCYSRCPNALIALPAIPLPALIMLRNKRSASSEYAPQSFSDFWKAYQVIPDAHQQVGKDSGETTHMERCYCTLRPRLPRLVRRSLSLSKAEAAQVSWHHRFIKWYIAEYNMNLLSSLTA